MIGLIQCSSKKLEMTCAAREMYSASVLFQKSLAYAERRCSKVYVVSGLHGLVELDQVIKPYERRLPSKEAPAWARRVVGRLFDRHGKDGYWLILAGADYAGPLVKVMTTWDGWFSDGWHGIARDRILTPLHQMTIGARLHYLKEDRDVA